MAGLRDLCASVGAGQMEFPAALCGTRGSLRTVWTGYGERFDDVAHRGCVVGSRSWITKYLI